MTCCFMTSGRAGPHVLLDDAQKYSNLLLEVLQPGSNNLQAHGCGNIARLVTSSTAGGGSGDLEAGPAQPAVDVCAFLVPARVCVP